MWNTEHTRNGDGLNERWTMHKTQGHMGVNEKESSINFGPRWIMNEPMNYKQAKGKPNTALQPDWGALLSCDTSRLLPIKYNNLYIAIPSTVFLSGKSRDQACPCKSVSYLERLHFKVVDERHPILWCPCMALWLAKGFETSSFYE